MADAPRDFATTHWSLVRSVVSDSTDPAATRAALEALCRMYWYPVYAFLRRRGHDPEDARDLTQGFFARLIETHGLDAVDPARGRFRSYLLGAVKHFLSSERRKAGAARRGGQERFTDWDGQRPEELYVRQAQSTDDPEVLFDREWARRLTGAALDALGAEMARAGKQRVFDTLKGTLTSADPAPREQLAAQLDMSAGALKVAIHRLRVRYGQLLRAAVAQTVSNAADLEDEIRYLQAVLRNS